MNLPRKYNLLTSDNLSSPQFIVTHSENLSENCQLLRDIDFSVLANDKNIINLRLYDKDKKIIDFDYVTNKENPLQTFTNDQVKLLISFSYQEDYTRNHYILCCPSFTIYQNTRTCPCCRARFS